MKKKGNQGQSAQDILKKIEKQSTDEKKKRTMDILQGKIKNTQGQTSSFYNKYRSIYNEEWARLVRKVKNPLNQRTAMMTFFMMFSIYIGYKIQQKYDKMRKVATKTKTYKQMQIQKQDAYINKYLKRNQFEPVPVKNQEDFDPNYKYQEQENMVLDTRDDLLQAVAKQYNSGMKIDPQMQEELRRQGMI